jgi:hypothetical protein
MSQAILAIFSRGADQCADLETASRAVLAFAAMEPKAEPIDLVISMSSVWSFADLSERVVFQRLAPLMRAKR